MCIADTRKSFKNGRDIATKEAELLFDAIKERMAEGAEAIACDFKDQLMDKSKAADLEKRIDDLIHDAFASAKLEVKTDVL